MNDRGHPDDREALDRSFPLLGYSAEFSGGRWLTFPSVTP